MGKPAQLMPPGDNYCVRDAFCELMNWSENSEEYRGFQRGFDFCDVIKMASRHGLVSFEWDYEQNGWIESSCGARTIEFETARDHPGVAIYLLPSVKWYHCIFHPHIRWVVGLPREYDNYKPKLSALIIDLSQQPRD